MKVKVICLLITLSATSEINAKSSGGPYEPYARPIRSVINQLDSDDADFDRVCQLMRRGRSFHYRMNHPYRASSPEVTEALGEGSCQDKSLWLASRMNDDSIEYVIGRARGSSNGLHAWLQWKSHGHAWVLDCTNYSKPIRRDQIPHGQYVPYYHWSKDK
jgi:hypothetical protein